MHAKYSLSVVALSAASAVNALSLHQRDQPAVLAASLHRRDGVESLSKRDASALKVSIHNNETGYLLNLTLGSPAQNFTLVLDTGSSDLWVPAANGSNYEYGSYQSSSSSTYKSLNMPYNATYADGTTALGDYATDTLGIGGATVKDFQFIVVNQSSSNIGIAGVGYNISTFAGSHDNKVYSNLPYALAASGITKSPAYSLWMDDINANTGTILFGGVNKANYVGDLQTLPVVPVYNQYYSLAIALTEVIVQTGGKSTTTKTSLPVAVSLDTGSTLSSLPQDLLNDIIKPLNGTLDEKNGAVYVDCGLMKSNNNVTFSFSGAQVAVGLSQLVLESAYPGWPSNSCLFGITPSHPGINILGDTFLRSAYVVYDLDNNEISLANTNFNPGKDDILEIGTGTAPVPGATLVPSAVSTATGNGAATATATATTGVVSGTGPSTSTSKAIAAMPTAYPNRLLSGLAGAGLLLMM